MSALLLSTVLAPPLEALPWTFSTDRYASRYSFGGKPQGGKVYSPPALLVPSVLE